MIVDIKNYKNCLKRLKIGLNSNYRFIAYLSLIVSIISACATVQRPTGGPRDETPPKILLMEPENLTTNFDNREVQITFDEYFRLQNEFTEISISPDMNELPEYKIRKRTLIITLPDSLEENTTYAINFGNSIVDFNEGNELKGFSYVFSTGPEIDSLSISGKVINALTLEPEEEVSVLLIPTQQDSIFGKRKANIFTRTDTAGNFILKNLHEGSYNIYGLKETNNDRIYNNPNEMISFINETIELKKDTSGIQLVLFKEIPKDFRVNDRSIDSKGKIIVVFNKPLEDPSIEILNDENLNQNKVTEFTNTKDTAYLWLPELNFDSLELQISNRKQILDTTLLRRNNRDKYDREITFTDNLNRRQVDRTSNLVFTTSAPIKEYDKDKIILLEDSVRRNNYAIEMDSSTSRKLKIIYNWKAKRDYEVKLEKGALKGFFDEESALTDRVFTYDESENYGNFTLDVSVPDTSIHYLIQLLNEKDVILAEGSLSTSKKIEFHNLPGIKYKVRVVYDENKNNYWDTGNVEEKIQPEKVWFGNKIISIRPNWDQEDVLIIPPMENSSNKTDDKEEKSEPEVNTEVNNDQLDIVPTGV